MKEFNICIASDDNYAEHMHVCIYSMIYNLDKFCFANVYILDWWISTTKLNSILNMEKEFDNLKINIIKVTDPKFDKMDKRHLTKEMYFRIDAPYFFENLDYIVYLDCDIIVNWDLSELLSIHIWNNLLWAPNDFWSYNAYKYLLWIPDENNYFNSWFLFMNLEQMRKEKTPEKIFDYLEKKRDKIITWDQDAINAVCYNKRFILPLKYNATALSCQPFNGNFSNDEYKDAKHNPIIIHYACAKPRNKRCFHPKRKLYHKYRKLAWLNDVKYPSWFEFNRLCKSIFEVVWNFLIASVPANIYHYIVWRPKMFLSKIIKF